MLANKRCRFLKSCFTFNKRPQAKLSGKRNHSRHLYKVSDAFFLNDYSTNVWILLYARLRLHKRSGFGSEYKRRERWTDVVPWQQSKNSEVASGTPRDSSIEIKTLKKIKKIQVLDSPPTLEQDPWAGWSTMIGQGQTSSMARLLTKTRREFPHHDVWSRH